MPLNNCENVGKSCYKRSDEAQNLSVGLSNVFKVSLRALGCN